MLRQIAISLLLVLLGVVITLAALYFGIGAHRRTPESERERYIVEYTKSEQDKKGIDCRKLKADLRAFLTQKVQPVLTARKPGAKWDELVSDELRKEAARYREVISTCGNLYRAGGDGRINDLRELDFISHIENDYLTLLVLIRHGAPSQNCNVECLDNRFRELQLSYQRVVERLA